MENRTDVKTQEEEIEEGIPLSSDDKFWLKQMQEMTVSSVKSIEEAGKQLIGMITVMQGIYAAVLAFSGIKEIPKANILSALVYISPIFLWLISLFFALRVFKTRKYHYYSNSPDSSEATFQKIADFKHKNLNLSYIFLCISFAVASMGIIYWLYRGTGF
jgi:Ca2+/Na+ antiporter